MIDINEFMKEASTVSFINPRSDEYMCETTMNNFIFGDNIFEDEERASIRTTINKIKDIDSEEINHFLNSDNIRFTLSEPQLTYLCALRKIMNYKLCMIQKRTDITRILENRYILSIDGIKYLLFSTDESDVIYGVSTRSQIIDGEKYRNILKLEMDDNNYELKASELDDTPET